MKLAVMRLCRKYLTAEITCIKYSFYDSLITRKYGRMPQITSCTEEKTLGLQCLYGINIKNMLYRSDWQNIEDRLLSLLLLATLKVLQSKSPCYYYSRVKPIFPIQFKCPKEGHFSFPKANISFLECTVVYRGLKTWIALPLSMTALKQTSVF